MRRDDVIVWSLAMATASLSLDLMLREAVSVFDDMTTLSQWRAELCGCRMSSMSSGTLCLLVTTLRPCHHLVPHGRCGWYLVRETTSVCDDAMASVCDGAMAVCHWRW